MHLDTEAQFAIVLYSTLIARLPTVAAVFFFRGSMVTPSAAARYSLKCNLSMPPAYLHILNHNPVEFLCRNSLL